MEDATKKYTTITARVPRTLAKKIRTQAKEEKRSMSVVIVMSLEKYLKE